MPQVVAMAAPRRASLNVPFIVSRVPLLLAERRGTLGAPRRPFSTELSPDLGDTSLLHLPSTDLEVKPRGQIFVGDLVRVTTKCKPGGGRRKLKS